VVFFTGMVNPNFAYVGIDGAVHLAEDALNAATAVPWALIAAVGIGFVTCFPFVVAMFYCITDIDTLLSSPVPIFGIFEQATRSGKGATAMTALLILTGFFALNATQQSSSRLSWSFARDGGLVFSGQIAKIHPTLGVPVWALLFNAFVVFVMGCINLGSSVAFAAIVGTCLILMHLSIAIPIIFLMANGRNERFLPRKGHWNMGALGWLWNFLSVAWALLILIFYCFPTTNPTTSGMMNYACVVLAVFALCGAVNWFVYARTRYQGPKIDLDRLEALTARA
jgi:choline transport protein